MVGDIAHICNRGVEKRNIFLSKQDYIRFRDNLFLLNNVDGKIRTRETNIRNVDNSKQKKLVEILKWSLLPNHYHLLVVEATEGGILEFTKRLGNAYTKYFNLKNKGRSGYLFQNKARIILIIDDSQFLYIPFYIDLNPLDIRFHKWKQRHPAVNESSGFLKSYEWSSFKDYFGNGNYECVISKDKFYDLFDTNVKRYEKELFEFMASATVSTWQVDTL